MSFTVRAVWLLLVLVSVPFVMESFEVPKAAVLRAAGLGALVVGLAAPEWRRRAAWSPLDLALAGWLGIETLATLWSVDIRLSLLGSTKQDEGWLTSLGLAGLYLAARRSLRPQGAVERLLGFCFAVGAVAAVYALLQAAGLDPVSWRNTAGYGAGFATMRPASSLGHPNLLGAVMAGLAVAAATLAWLESARRLQRAALAALFAAALLVTLSRAAWLGAGAGLAVAVVLGARGRPAPRTRPSAWMAAALGGLALVGAAAFLASGWGELVRSRFAELLDPASISGRTRLEIWKGALAAWQARPLLGHGPDTFELVHSGFQTPEYWRYEWAAVPFHAHSVYLETLVTRGLLGALALVAVAAAQVWTARRAWRTGAQRPALIALLGMVAPAAGAGAFGAIGVTGAAMVAVALAGVAGLAEAAREEAPAVQGAARPAARGAGRAAAPPAPPGAPAAARLAAGFLVLASLAWSVVDLLASHDSFRAVKAYSGADAGNPADHPKLLGAVAEARRAVALDPWDDALACLHATACLRWADAAPEPRPVAEEGWAAAERAVRLSPLRSLNHFTLAWAHFVRARLVDARAVAAAERAFERGMELSPMDGPALIQMARFEILAGRSAQALPLAERAAALYPGEAQTWTTLGQVYVDLGQVEKARVALGRALQADWRGLASERERIRKEYERLFPGR